MIALKATGMELRMITTINGNPSSTKPRPSQNAATDITKGTTIDLMMLT